MAFPMAPSPHLGFFCDGNGEAAQISMFFFYHVRRGWLSEAYHSEFTSLFDPFPTFFWQFLEGINGIITRKHPDSPTPLLCCTLGNIKR